MLLAKGVITADKVATLQVVEHFREIAVVGQIGGFDDFLSRQAFSPGGKCFNHSFVQFRIVEQRLEKEIELVSQWRVLGKEQRDR